MSDDRNDRGRGPSSGPSRGPSRGPGGNDRGGDRRGGDRPGGDRPGGDRPGGDRPGGDRGRDRPSGNRTSGNRTSGNRPGGDRPGGDRGGFGGKRPPTDRRGSAPKPGANRPEPRREPLATLPRLFVAIDTTSTANARQAIQAVTKAGAGVKIGLEFFSRYGINGTRKIVGDAPLFLDLKFHDIPNTVAGAVRAIRELNPEIINVHAAGGLAMMKAAKEAANPRTKVIAVTVLTSMDSNDLVAVGQDSDAARQAVRLAKLAKAAGMDGVVCSAHEAQAIADATSPDFMRITPGIRFALTGASTDDQKRVMSPAEAFKAGSTHLVMGRMITNAPDPAAVVRLVMGAADA